MSKSTYEGSNAPAPVENMTDAPHPCCLETPGTCLRSRLIKPQRLGRVIDIIACRTELATARDCCGEEGNSSATS